MSFLKKGPELKLSKASLAGIKVPGFLRDLYLDLKERHLLPIVAVLLIGIVAVPIAIGDTSGSEEAAPPIEAGDLATGSPAEAQAAQLVAEAAPGLRDYRRRLKALTAKDPFEQHYAEEGKEGAGGTETGSGGGESGGSSVAATGTGGGTHTPPEPSAEPTSATTTHDQAIYYSYAIDVRVSGSGEGGSKKSTVRHNLPELTMLPSRETPAIVFMGATKDGKKAVMTVSSDVQAIFGDAKCVLGSERCELLVMEPGLPVTFVYGGAARPYKIELRKIELVESDKLNRAPLGRPKEREKEKGGS